ncbi:MAG: cob(I)yrinic acid a,c-diamide adenosyltransferase [Holophaga sp.]|nr:cob(I)yrinic acid a,c-diamide adenosyltransferase [Holophaga sp.]
MTPQIQEDPGSHQHRMGQRKAAVDRRIASATREKGLLMVHTGNGKGKSTAALGMLVRCLGHGYPCAVVQFIKGEQATAEGVLENVAAAMGGSLSWDRCGQGFTWEIQDHAADVAHARAGWDLVRRHLADAGLRFLLLDELNIVLRHGLLDTAGVLADLQARKADLHVVLTGRGAPEALVDAADLVTEMKDIKHPFRAGIKAQAGIEF